MSAKAAATVVDLGAGDGGDGKKKKKKLLLIVAILVVVLAAGGGAAAFFLMGGKKKGKAHKKADAEEHAEAQADEEEGTDDEHAADEEEADEGHKKPPVYLSLDPFVVNLAAESADRYLQVAIDVKVSAPEISEKVKQHLPEIRNGILLILSSKTVEELATLEGKNKLRNEIRDAVNKPLGFYKGAPAGSEGKSKPPKKGAQDVLLTSFVIQ